MQQLLFSFISAIIGLNFIAVSAVIEKGKTPVLAHYTFQSIPQKEAKNKEENSAGIAFTLTSQITPIPSLSIISTETPSEETKVEAYNKHLSKVIGSVSENAVEHSKTLIPCSDPTAECNPTSTPSATLSPTSTPSPSLTHIPSISITLTPTIKPEITIPAPIDPPCDRFELPVKENNLQRVPCIY